MEDICQCPICFESFCLTRKPLIFPCGHTICDPCVSDILLAQKPCPICMKQIPSDKNSFIINYSLIPVQALQKPAIDHSTYTKKLIQEIEFFEGINKTLTTIQDECSEQIQKTGNEINLCFKSFELSLEKLKSTIKERNNKLIEHNNEKITKQKKEIFDLAEKRKKILKNIMEAQSKGIQIGVGTLFELNMLGYVKPIEVVLRVSDFKYDVELDIFKIQEGFKQKFQVVENPYEFMYEDQKSFEVQKAFDSGHGDEQRVNPGRREFQVNEETEIVKSRNEVRIDQNIKYNWSIYYGNRQVRLPDFALGQIERYRAKGKNRIKIFREGKTKFIADLNSMEYFTLDPQERIIPNQTARLICNPY